ncbi:hypothetical protein Q5752_002158 [Cryptotrichosporon argae]
MSSPSDHAGPSRARRAPATPPSASRRRSWFGRTPPAVFSSSFEDADVDAGIRPHALVTPRRSRDWDTHATVKKEAAEEVDDSTPVPSRLFARTASDRAVMPLTSPAKPLPALPDEIVVTPSSPHAQLFPRASIIGLGHPLAPGTPGTPPALPAKQAVSSPLPSRPVSPTPKVSFGETADTVRGRSTSLGPRRMIKRARSLSGLFGRDKDGGVGATRAEDSDAEEVLGEAGKGAEPSTGVFSWLSVKKTIRRRRSDTKLVDLGNGDSVDSHRETPVASPVPEPLTSVPPPSRPVEIPHLVPMPPIDSTWSSAPDGWTASPTADMEFDLGSSWTLRPWVGSHSHRSSVSSSSSPLESLPESGLPDPQQQAEQIAAGRNRSWSDAPSLSASSPSRPAIGGRTTSGNSIILDKVRGVFKAPRHRSNSALRYSDMEDLVNEGSPTMPPVRIRDDVPQLSLGDGNVVLSGLHNQSPRSSISSRAPEPIRSQPPIRARARARASTIASGAGAYQPPSAYQAPPSPNVFAAAATPPRHRPGSLRRLSNGLFRGSTSPKTASLFPLPPRSSGSMSSLVGYEDGPFGSASPRMSVGSMSMTTPTIIEGEAPEEWVSRLGSYSRRDVAGLLAASGDAFHQQALKAYMSRFDFTHSALDIALRRLLMHLSLPKETQQIDRVIQAFADRYDECEPGLFGSKDNSYVLAFSMMMLHTDAFNKHNKNKMTKVDYVRNTRLDGVHPVVLEVFFDNITFTPFVFIEDEGEMRSDGAVTPLSRVNKIDVYDLIVRGRISSLRIDIEQHIPAETPFLAIGTRPVLDMDGMHKSFSDAHVLTISAPRPRRRSLSSAVEKNVSKLVPDTTLRITKVGLLSRKEESASHARKWRTWSVILTGSQLLFFKDPTWVQALDDQIRNAVTNEAGHKVLPRMSVFKPDEVLALRDCIAVFDRDYAKYPNTFRFVTTSRQYLLQASNEDEMNDWVSLINYASAFKTSDIRMRASGMNSDQASLAGAAAAASHKRDVQVGAAATLPRTAKRSTEGSSGVIDVDNANTVVRDSSEQLEEVFGAVKAELAAGRGGAVRTESAVRMEPAPSRAELVKESIRQLRLQSDPIETRLAASLRAARNLAILTPFQKSTRDRVEAVVPAIAASIRRDRLEIAKLQLFTAILIKDVEMDERDFARVRHVALQAAAKSLRNGVASVAGPTSGRAPRATGAALPVLSLPDGAGEELPVLSLSRRPSENGYEALGSRKNSAELDVDGGTSGRASSEYLSASEGPESAGPDEDELRARLTVARVAPRPRQPRVAGDDADVGHAHVAHAHTAAASVDRPAYYAAHEHEEAEEWQNTRAAKRVSLATIPPAELRKLSHKMSKMELGEEAEVLVKVGDGEGRSRSGAAA